MDKNRNAIYRECIDNHIDSLQFSGCKYMEIKILEQCTIGISGMYTLCFVNGVIKPVVM